MSAAPGDSARPTAIRQNWCVTALIALHAVLLAWAVVANSVTFDEFAHLPAGTAYWKYGAFGIYSQSPPLLRLWAAAPVMLAGVRVPDVEPAMAAPGQSRHWRYGDMFQAENYSAYPRLFVIARLFMIPLSCLGAWIVYCWARDLYGAAAGLLACAMYVLCPNIAAHASLVTTDAGTTTALLASLWLWQRFCRQPSWRSLLPACFAIGLAHLCKFSALLLWPALLGMAVWFTGFERGRHWKARLGGLATAGAATLLLVNLMYGFGGTGTHLRSFQSYSAALASLQTSVPDFPVPLPAEYVLGFDRQKWEAEGLYEGFLFGEHYRGSRWYYYPVALGCKLPLAVLALAAFAAVSPFLLGGAPLRWWEGTAPLLLAAGVFAVGMIVLADINIGIRYLLPLFPLAYVAMSRVAAPRTGAPRIERWRAVSCGGLVAILAIENASAAPRYLTFFNAAVGGPSQGWKLLTDSNCDWGQGLIDLRSWMKSNSVERVQLAYFGRVDPGVYGVNAGALDLQSSERFQAFSSYFVVGGEHLMMTPSGKRERIRIAFAKELRERKPIAIVGNSILIYDREAVRAASDASRR